MATNKRQVLIRVQPNTYEKLKVISDQNHRSVSNQLEWLMLQFIADYEKQNGLIPLAGDGGHIVQNNHLNLGGTNILSVGGNFSVADK